MGKYEKNGNRIDMPVNITIAHAVADGYHIGLFFEYLQNEINASKIGIVDILIADKLGRSTIYKELERRTHETWTCTNYSLYN